MAVHAARTALSRSSSSAEPVGMLFHSAVFFQGPEMWSVPGYILRELGIEGASATEIRNGCNGMFTAIELAAALLPRLPDDRPEILLTTADNFNSPLVNHW
ncbi:hypothetical protein ACIRBZ_45005 [Streptomyces sp. NPDC094038]|uniref:hypothetical protein n=1 Tax=Streptomyces sp. NPDC094038 TaxID=3366055 RepID=UPI00381E2E8C